MFLFEMAEWHAEVPPDGRWLLRIARAWAQSDVEVDMGARLLDLVEAADLEGLRAACEPPLEFGTAGLRGEVGPGPARMNLSTVGRAAWALGEFVRHRCSQEPTVIVGFDARPDSRRFAEYAARVLGGLGVQVLLGEEPLPTPIIAYAARKSGASAAMVLTASHNPRADGGMKVFDDRGVQIVAPWDTEIARRIEEAPAARALLTDDSRVAPLPESFIEAYVRDSQETATHLVPLNVVSPDRADPSGQPILLPYTPLHGVGLASTERVLVDLPGVRLLPVAAQADPDGRFPTVEFPNPEERGALDLLLALATNAGARVACAHDPDADRFALCLPLGEGGRLVRLSGDALGILFADLCLRATSVVHPTLISTVVSTPALEQLASIRDGRVRRTLTGFKWLCHAALEEESFVFAYEEAIGYCFAPAPGKIGALDKDGIVALLIAARLLVQEGGGDALATRLLGLYREIGMWGSYGVSRRFETGGLSLMREQMGALRSKPPTRLGGLRVLNRTDFLEGADERDWALGRTDLLCFELEGEGDTPVASGRVLVRPSGTEPKLKAYIHLRTEFGATSDYGRTSALQMAMAHLIGAEVLGEEGT